MSRDEFWDRYHATWPDMTLVNALIHEGADSATIHEAMCALREGRTPDIDPEREHDPRPGPSTRWVIGGMGWGIWSRKIDEPGRSKRRD